MKKILLVLTVILTSFATQAQDTLIKGKLFDANTNNLPIAFGNVTVKETKESITTDFRGNYFFENLPPGTYTLEFAFLGYATFSKKIVITENQIQVLDAYLKPSQAINFDNIVLASISSK